VIPSFSAEEGITVVEVEMGMDWTKAIIRERERDAIG
jgi:hypothetical protein